MKKICLYSCLIIGLLMSTAIRAWSQTSGPPKITIYKVTVNENAEKDGIRGISVLFSAEYSFGDQVFATLRDSEGKTFFDFFASIADNAKRPLYNAANYSSYRKSNKTTAVHWAEEAVYEPKVKAQGRRSTGVELFIPFMHIDAPSGAQTIRFTFNAAHQKAGTFRDLHTQEITINKPPVYFISLVPQQIAVLDKSGKSYAAESLEQDIVIAPGTNNAATDEMTAVSANRQQVVPFKYSTGDALRLKVQKSRRTGTVGRNTVRTLKGANGQNLTNFDNKAAIAGEWPLNVNAGKTVNFKNDAVQLAFAVEKVTVPPVKITEFAIDPYATHASVAGAKVTFACDAPANAPVLTAVPTYAVPDAAPAALTGGKVIAGKATLDSTGIITLNGPGKIEVFYPAFNLLLNHPAIRQQAPENFTLHVRLQHHTDPIAQKEIPQKFPVSVIQDAKVASAVRATDTTFNGVRGITTSIPYEVSPLYFELLKGQVIVRFAEPSAKETRGTDILRIMKPVNTTDAKPASDPLNRKGVAFQLTQPKGAIRLFMPYTDLNRPEKAPLAFTAKVLASRPSETPVEVGGGASTLRFELDEQKIKLITVGVSPIKLKKAEGDSFAWRVSSSGRVLYQSPLIPPDKLIENLYSHSFYMHTSDKVTVEMLRGADTKSLKPLLKWEKPVSELAANESVELIPSAVLPGTDEGDTKSATLNYSAQ